MSLEMILPDCMDEKYSFMYMHYVSFLYSSINGHWSWFYAGTTMNSTVTNMGVRMLSWQTDFISFEYIPRNGTAES